ncbi:hypothetical protein [Arenicella xantha]|uniref:Glucose-1-phosphate adenylyltransferase n=1 Tax=Arenicella xantha TaxID=644221 RepID=A0A395JLW2_9GAMM|nr:hypothetical protein [Arenicella xantha]RBP51415.1 hypothetical protein DFR28_102842 [Arenicella xantha]
MNNEERLIRPTAIVLADDMVGSDLASIFSGYGKASLMVAGYSVIEHLLMELEDLGFDQCLVLAKNDARRIQTLIGDTRRWGMSINVMDYQLSTDQVLSEYQSLGDPNGLLVINLDRLRSHCVDQFLTEANRSEGRLLAATAKGQLLGLTLLKPHASNVMVNAAPIELIDVVVNSLSSAGDFKAANFSVVSGDLAGLLPSVHHNSRVGRRQHWEAYVHRRAVLVPKEVMIERRCRIAKNASLDTVILNRDVLIGPNVSLTDTIVMPNSIVSTLRPIHGAIVNKGVVYQVS